MTEEGPLAVYRDRSKKEIRDIHIKKNKNGVWQDSKPVHNDGWVINGCPVNGPKVISNSLNLAVAWFTASHGIPIVSYMETDDLGTYLRVKKVSIDGKISDSITVANIDGGRNTGVPQLEIINDEIFIVWTISKDGKNQLKSIKFNSEDLV